MHDFSCARETSRQAHSLTTLLSLFDSLIGTLLLGYLDDSGSRNDEDESRSYLPSSIKTNDGFAVPAARAPRSVPSMLPNNKDDDEEDVDPLGN